MPIVYTLIEVGDLPMVDNSVYSNNFVNPDWVSPDPHQELMMLVWECWLHLARIFQQKGVIVRSFISKLKKNQQHSYKYDDS